MPKRSDELALSFSDPEWEAGVDEAGRGPLAGPVVAAAVILPEGFHLDGLTDSKLIAKSAHRRLAELIKAESLAWGCASASVEEIDEINILQATFLAMHRAIDQLAVVPEHLLIDGNRFNGYPFIPHQTMVKGDSRFMNIAAASLIAKSSRDSLMMELHEQFPEYGWNTNAGYPTKAHRSAIKKFGVTVHHRKSFRLLGAEE